MNYNKSLIENLINHNPNQTRFDCPNCYGANTLSIYKNPWNISWHCFRASCGIWGDMKNEISLNDIQSIAQATRSLGSDHNTNSSVFSIPDYWCSPLNNDVAYNYLRNNHCIYAYSKDLVDIKYDPKQNRVVFICKDDKGVVRNAVGRSLESLSTPKWLVFGNSTYPLFVGHNTSTAILVEDAASACAVSEVYTGVAILGTSFRFDYWHLLQKYDRVIIALDQDALRKGIKLEHAMSLFCKNVSVQYLKRDLKYLDIKEIKEIIG